MIGREMRECPADAQPVKFEQNFSEEEIQQYVEDREVISGPRRSVHLWEFLLELLMDETQSSVIQWTDEMNGEFKLKSSEDVARKWGQRKHKEGMNYDKLSRALRYYYSKNIIKKVSGRRFVYKFVPSPEMHAAVNAIKAHMLRSGQKLIPGGPFPHLQTQETASHMPSTNNTKPYVFYPVSRNSISPRLATPNYSIPKACHSPVRCRSPHRHDGDRYGEDRKLFRPHPYGFDYVSKMNFYCNDESERIMHPRVGNFRTRHHSEQHVRHSDREMDLYRLTPPTDYPEHKTNQVSYAEDKNLRELYNQSHPFGVHHHREGDDLMSRRKEEIVRHNESYECNKYKNGYIDLSSTRRHKLPLPHVIRQEFDKQTRNHQSTSPKTHRVQDIIDYPTRQHNHHRHHERHYSSSIYETQKREFSKEPYCYMYRRYSPMVDAATQTGIDHKERDISDFDTRQHVVLSSMNTGTLQMNNDDGFVGEELKVERSPSATSSSPLNIKDRMSEGSPDVFSSAEMNSPISTPNSLIHHPLTPVSTPIPQQVLTPAHCKCGCMEKIEYSIGNIVARSNTNAHVTSVTNDTVVVFPKEVY